MRTNAPPQIRGGGAQRLLLRSIVRGISDLRITSIRIGPASKEWHLPGTVWLSFKIRAANGGEYTHGIWQANIVEGVFATESRHRGWRRVSGGSFTIVLPSGREYLDSEDVFSLGPAVDTPTVRLEGIVRRAIEASPLTLRAVRFDRPLGHVAVKILALTADPRGFLRNRDETIARLVRPINRPEHGPPLADGTLVEVHDPMGRWVTASGYATRSGLGVGSTNPIFK